MHGQFVWYELTTPDVDDAKRFYPLIAGWGTQPFDGDYAMWTTDGTPFAGLYALTDEMKGHGVPPNWMPYVEVDDVDASAKLATSMGGQVVHGPVSLPDVGRFAVLHDPQGAMVGLYKSTRPSMSWDGTPALGRFSWHELMAADHEKAFEFYHALFGWKNSGEMDMGGGSMYLMFGQEQMFGGMFTRSGDMQGMHPFWLVYILVPSVVQAVAVATKAGAKLMRGPMPIPGGTIAILGDPQGAAFAVHQMDQTPRPAVKTAADVALEKRSGPQDQAWRREENDREEDRREGGRREENRPQEISSEEGGQGTGQEGRRKKVIGSESTDQEGASQEDREEGAGEGHEEEGRGQEARDEDGKEDGEESGREDRG